MKNSDLASALTALREHFNGENKVIDEVRSDYLGNPILFLQDYDQNGHRLEYKYNLATNCLERIKWWRD